MNPCDEAKQFLIEHLEEDIAAHERGDYARIGEAKNRLPSFKECAEENVEEEERLSVAYNFWDSWMDARNHDWGYYAGVERED